MAAEGDDRQSVGSDESESEREGVLRSMRRRAASDDEGVEQSYGGDQPRGIDSGGESGDEGAAPEYEDDVRSEGEVEDEDEEFDEELEDEIVDERREVDGRGVRGGVAVGGLEGRRDEEPEKYDGEDRAEGEEEKVVNAPYAVPTGGAFYMHDDRFRQNGRGGRHRRMPGGKKLWENKDDQVWVHDRFEELNLRDTRHGESRRASRGRFRGRVRGRSRARDADYGFGSANKSQVYNNDNYQNHAPRSVKGRGPRRYEFIKRGKEMPANKEHVNPHEVMSNTRMSRSMSSNPSAEQASAPRKNVVSSNLNYASPPFYPSGSSNKDAYESQRSIEKSGPTNRNPASSSVQLMKGKGPVGSSGYNKLYMEDSVQTVSGRASVSAQLQASMSGQFSESIVQERGKIVNGLLNSQTLPLVNTTTQVSAPTESPIVHQRQFQNSSPISSRTFTQSIRQQTGYGSRSSPPLEASTNSLEDGEKELHAEPGRSKSQLVRFAKPNPLGHGRGTFLYNGAQVLGATGTMGIANGDQGFQAAPTMLPFMSIGGQHPGGVGVPAVGVALPGYMAPPHGYGNSEMTWLPVLAGAPGALGATYPPYIALDCSFYARTSGQASSTPSSRENNSSKPADTQNQSQMPEIPNDELLLRQGKPRRYSEMTFGQ